MHKFSGAENIYCELVESVCQEMNVTVMYKAMECTLNTAAVPECFLKSCQWCSFNFCVI